MHRLQELVRLHREGRGAREVARLLRMSPNTERRYRNRLGEAGLLEGDVNLLPELAVLKAAVVLESRKLPDQECSTVEEWKQKVEEKLAAGAGPTAIHQALQEEEPEYEGSLSAIKRLCLRIKLAKGIQEEDVSITVHTPAGEQAQVDFGYVGKQLDPQTGHLRRAWVFVMVLGFSRHMFAKVVFDQKIATWLQLHREAFEWFGGVPEIVVPDNLKSAVIRAAFGVDETAINRSYREIARHYHFAIDPTPPRDPRKKGKVESGVKYVKNNFFKARTFEDVVSCNERLARWVLQTAGTRIHGTTGRQPLIVFREEEAHVLRGLPVQPFEPVIWHKAKVARNCHFVFEKAFYSVPWQNMESTVWMRATNHSVVVYRDNDRIATHTRILDGDPDRWATNELHLPESRREWRHRSVSYWLERADGLGEEVGAYIRQVFESDREHSRLRKVQGMIGFLDGLPLTRARAACSRASFFGNTTLAGLKRIVDRCLDLEELPADTPMSPHWSSEPRFARKATEFLLHLEVVDEPH